MCVVVDCKAGKERLRQGGKIEEGIKTTTGGRNIKKSRI
jgi:hypothetical protein